MPFGLKGELLLFLATLSLLSLVRRRGRLVSLNASSFLRRALRVGLAGCRPFFNSSTLRKRALSSQGFVLAALHIHSVELEVVYILAIS